MDLAKAKEFLLQHLISLSVGLVAGTIVLLAHQLVPVIWPSILAGLPSQVLLSLLALTTMVAILLLVFLLIALRGRSLHLLNGFFWDRSGNPHCPSCKTPLSQYADYSHYLGGYGAKCVKCDAMLAFYDQDGKNTTVDVARIRRPSPKNK